MVSGAYKSEYGDSDEITQCLNEVAVSCTYMYIRVLRKVLLGGVMFS